MVNSKWKTLKLKVKNSATELSEKTQKI